MADERRAEARKEALDEGLNEGRLAEARSALRRVLTRRKLVINADSQARIDACTDLTTLERWLEQAVDAASVAIALK